MPSTLVSKSFFLSLKLGRYRHWSTIAAVRARRKSKLANAIHVPQSTRPSSTS